MSVIDCCARRARAPVALASGTSTAEVTPSRGGDAEKRPTTHATWRAVSSPYAASRPAAPTVTRAVAPAGIRRTRPEVGSVAVATSATHAATHPLDAATHDVPAPQAAPHAPQFVRSLRRSTHAAPQRVSPVGHPATHAPAEQFKPAAHGAGV
ncbi:MAG: hypothetical protein R3A52_03400 [Polyangiales bacterium]